MFEMLHLLFLEIEKQLPAELQATSPTPINRSTAEKWANIKSGREAGDAFGGPPEDVSKPSLDRSLAQLDSSAKAVRDALLGQAATNGTLKTAFDESYKAMNALLDPNSPFTKIVNGETTLNLSMNKLEKAIDAMREAYMGKNTNPFGAKSSQQQATENADDERQAKWIAETRAKQNNDSGVGLPMPVQPKPTGKVKTVNPKRHGS